MLGPADRREVIVAISWILELPHDLGLPEDSRVEILRPGGLYGWSAAEMTALPGWDSPQPDVHPVVALRFRRAQVGIGMPTEATDRCFGDMQTDAMTRAQRREFARRLDRLVARGAREWKTVVRITRWYADSELVEADQAEEWLRPELRAGLSVLNRWLATYALASASRRHGPLAPGDLPGAVPTVFEHKTAPEDETRRWHFLLTLHDRMPSLVSAEADMTAADVATTALLMDESDNPFLDGLQLLFGAQGQLAAGRERQAILDSGTAVEMLVSALFRAIGEQRAAFDSGAAIRANFAQRFKHHLPLALGDGRTPAPDESAARATWLAEGYRTRNDVVHQGRDVQPDEADRAVRSAWELLDAMGRQLRASEDTAALGRLLEVVWYEDGAASAGKMT